MSDDDTRPTTYLFIGDSITDCERTRDVEGIGYGYVRLIAEHVAAYDPASRVINRGISGNRAKDLRERFARDCLDLDPDVVTIYVGVNDTWRRYDQDDPTTADAFEEDYRYLLDQLSARHPDRPVVLVIPFIVDVDPEKARFHEDLDVKVGRIRQLAKEFSAEVVDLEEVVAHALQRGHTPSTIAADGVHPTTAGHRLIADAWLHERGLDTQRP